jgi:hypothetical protein
LIYAWPTGADEVLVGFFIGGFLPEWHRKSCKLPALPDICVKKRGF